MQARLDRTTINASEVRVTADENAQLKADALSTVESSGGSAFKELGEGTVVAANGLIATNVLQAQADAIVRDSSITTTAASRSGDVTVEAINDARLDATLLARTDTGEKGGGVTLAFNTLGWEAQNLLVNTFDALIGDPLYAGAFGGEVPARAHAEVSNTPIDAAGAINVHADNAAQLNATVSNAASSAASALFDAGGWSAAGLLASNKVSTSAKAYIDNSAQAEDLNNPDVNADGSIAITASDNAGIYANVKLVSSSISTNDGGASILDEVAADVLPVDFASSEGERQLEFGDRVRLADDYEAGGTPGGIYVYMGAAETRRIREILSQEDYSDLAWWKEALETQLIPQGSNFTPSDSRAVGGIAVLNELNGGVLAYIRDAVVAADGDVQVTAQENATLCAIADAETTSSGGDVFGNGRSEAYNGVISTNAMLSSADAYIVDSDVTTTVSGDVRVEAHNSSTVDAQTLAATTSGGDGVGILMAFNVAGFESQNLLFNSLDALFGLSELTEALQGALVDYDLGEDSNLTAETLASGQWVQLTSGEIFAYLGAERNNVTLSTEDYNDLTQWREVKSPFVSELPVRAQAYLLDTNVTAADDIIVLADSTASLNAVVSSDATSNGAAFYKASAMAASGVLASNKVSSQAAAFIDFTGPQGTIEAGGVVHVTADDAASIDAFSALGNTATRTNDLGFGLYNQLYNNLAQEYRYTTKSGTQTLDYGDMVLVAADYVLPGSAVDPEQETAGKLFKFMGTAETLDPAAEDYSNYGRWQEVNDTNAVPTVIQSLAFQTVQQDQGISGDDFFGTAKSYYGVVTRNDVRGDVHSYIQNANVQAGGVVHFDLLSSDTPNGLRSGQRVKLADDVGDAVSGEIYEYLGEDRLDPDDSKPPVDLSAEDYTDAKLWRKLDPAELDAVEVSAIEAASLTALDQSLLSGKGGLITTNQLQAQAIARIENSQVTAEEGGDVGDVHVHAENVATLQATAQPESKAGETVGIVVAFNSVGWDASNILFQALETLLGDAAFTSLLEADQDGAFAFIRDTTVEAAGDVSVTADASASLTATTRNRQIAEAISTCARCDLNADLPALNDKSKLEAKQGKTSSATGGTLASNKAKSRAGLHRQ